MGEEDYAVKAAREWLAAESLLTAFSGCTCNMCESSREHNTQLIEKLAAIIRKHVEGEVLPCGCSFATPDCKAR